MLSNRQNWYDKFILELIFRKACGEAFEVSAIFNEQLLKIDCWVC